jgi:hypothetical protein
MSWGPSGVCWGSVRGLSKVAGVHLGSGAGLERVHWGSISGPSLVKHQCTIFSIPTIGNVACFSKDGERTQSAEVKCLDGPFAPETESFHSSTYYLH